MSWIFGIIKSERGASILNNYKNIHSNTLLKLSLPKLYLAFGGIDETFFYEVRNESKDAGWAVVGLGIQMSGSCARFMNKNDWKNLFSQEILQTDSLDGHFAALRWNKDNVELYTDQLGIRTAYYGKCDEGICFSTRLDWVAKKTGLHEINQTALGGRWLLFNQLSYHSCVKGIERLGPASYVLIKNGIISRHENHPWLPEFGNENNSQVKIILESLVRAAIESGRPVSLGLSGGFDSRTLLAILIAIAHKRFYTHSFGEEMDPDILISEKISRDFKLPRQYFNEPVPDPEKLISLAKSFVAQNILVEPASSIVKQRYYSQQYINGHLIIDGGFGEIARRHYLNRIVRLGRSALKGKNIDKLFMLMRVPRADIFTAECSRQIEDAARLSLETALNNMPPMNEIGIENFVDLLAVRTRFPNWGGLEQARTDAYVMSFMPMVQPSFLRAVFKTDVKFRANGCTYKDIIQSKEPRLKKYPLVKSGTTYPFGLPSVPAWIFVKTKNRISRPFIDTTPDRFLLQIKDYVRDLVHSTEVRNWYGYDRTKILTIIDKYYKGDKRYTKAVDWWLSFELWRQSLIYL